MKNLKKLSRTDLKELVGGKLAPNISSSAGGCADMCTPTGGSGDSCAQFGLTCGFFECNGQLINRCM